MQVVAYPIEAVRRFRRHWRMVSQRAKGINQVEQHPLLRQRIVSVPQAVNQLADLPGALWLLAHDLTEPPVANAGEGFQPIRLQINHPVAPAFGGFRLAGMELIRIHGDDGIG